MGQTLSSEQFGKINPNESYEVVERTLIELLGSPDNAPTKGIGPDAYLNVINGGHIPDSYVYVMLLNNVGGDILQSLRLQYKKAGGGEWTQILALEAPGNNGLKHGHPELNPLQGPFNLRCHGTWMDTGASGSGDRMHDDGAWKLDGTRYVNGWQVKIGFTNKAKQPPAAPNDGQAQVTLTIIKV
jgi:hypothetical protein